MLNAAFDLRASGVVQGVGFRPFVYRLAHRFGLVGWVYNATDGVHIHIEGPQADCLGFMQAIELEAPAAAIIDSLTASPSHVEKPAGFSIRLSVGGEAVETTYISPDLATCPNCLRELFDVADRRYGYPFINCTDCGPRFTIIEGLPYDRPLTTMRNFVMCEACHIEYHDPADRRFHAQPDACFDCGPQLSVYVDGSSQTAVGRKASQAMITQVATALKAGAIVAIKGLGGYHLACDATNQEVVLELRYRKRRSNKPLAVMMASLKQVEIFCQVSQLEADLLSGSVRPIVLLKRKPSGGSLLLAPSVAGNLSELGVMLPYTPLQHLLFSELDIPLVMTSGNISEEPIIGDVDPAHRQLDGVADLFLDNDRPISSRYDDSVVRVVNGEIQFIRRARGYAPLPLRLPLPAAEPLLAVGPEQKNCFCLTIGDKAYVSQHLGDMDDKAAMENWDHTRRLYQQLFTTTPRVLVADKHPEYLTSKWANDYARESGLGLYRVQHHHAHIAAVLAEAQAEVVAATPATIDHELKSHPERVVGFAFDGSGYGDDGTIWGGEVLLASLTSFKRLAHLRTVVMPGGSVAIRQPWRMAYAWLYTCGLLDHPGAQFLLEQIDYEAQSQLQVIIDRRLNSPLTSSMGRLFDAVSALIGVCREASYEGEPAIELEAVMQSRPADRQKAAEKQSNPTYHFSYGDGVIDLAPLLAAILDDMATGKPQADIALGFHQAVVSIVVELAEQLSVQTDCYDIALSGGVFMNRYLIEQLPSALRGRGLTVYTNRQLPPNDGCIAYGQAAVATAMGGVSTLATSQSSPSRKG